MPAGNTLEAEDAFFVQSKQSVFINITYLEPERPNELSELS